MNNDRLLSLLEKYRSGTCTESESTELEQWYLGLNEASKEQLLTEGDPVAEALVELRYSEFLERAQQTTAPDVKSRYRWITAGLKVAACIAVFAIGIYFIIGDSKKSPELADIPTNSPKDIPPGGDKAVLLLASGRRIVLDSTADGELATEGTTRIIKLDSGQLAYSSTAVRPSEVLYNTIYTPKGGQYKIVLPDGSKVWLNASSSLRYPTAFTGGQREVSLTGEAYFDVTKDKTKPFRVRFPTAAGNGKESVVEVLGTSFNINSYSDEVTTRTTLLEGAVKLVSDGRSTVLRPGQQATVDHDGTVNLNKQADVAAVTAWKDGYFHFDNTTVETAMRQISRWYNIEVTYAGNRPTENLTGRISRNRNLSEVLVLLERAGIRFSMEGNRMKIAR